MSRFSYIYVLIAYFQLLGYEARASDIHRDRIQKYFADSLLQLYHFSPEVEFIAVSLTV
jgi:hypothetical protein